MTSDQQIRKLKIVHFNDCYNIDEQFESGAIRGGASRFVNALLSEITENTVVLFSGDCLSPSIMSTITKGSHMIPVLNAVQTECAVFGNHEFDFGIDNLLKVVKQTKFPWLMSNVIDKETNQPLGDGQLFHIIERNQVRIGLIGIVEEEWLCALATMSRDDLIFLDYVDESRKLARRLKSEHRCDIVIALTHMRWKNDTELAKQVDEIDLYLGGHDHDYAFIEVNGKFVLKSGTDFREFSTIDLDVNLSAKKVDKIEIQKIEVTADRYAENEELKLELDKYKTNMESRLDEVIGCFEVPLDGRFAKIRTGETNLGNFIADVITSATKADCVILNSGTLRSDMVHEKGPFRLRDLFRILPAQYPMIVLQVTGRTIWEALENGVSKFPLYEGRFPQVSGIRFAFQPSNPPGQRVCPEFIKINDEYLDMEAEYSMATKVFISKGRDGYTMLPNSKVLISEEECQDLLCCVQNYFEAIGKILKGIPTHHRLSLVPGASSENRRKSVSRPSIGNHVEHHNHLEHNNVEHNHVGHNHVGHNHVDHNHVEHNHVDHNMNIDGRSPTRKSIEELELERCKRALAPRVEGRIIQITDEETLNQLKAERAEYEASKLRSN